MSSPQQNAFGGSLNPPKALIPEGRCAEQLTTAQFPNFRPITSGICVKAHDPLTALLCLLGTGKVLP
jgi:hypothetical protein